MNKTKFTVRVDPDAFKAAKTYAEQHGITVTSLVEEFFRSLEMIDQIRPDTPILNSLAGSLRADATLDDYHQYLEDKYLDGTAK